MRVFRFVPLALAVLLTGCLGGDVSRVKDSKLKGWPQYTVGQLLDKRQVCSSTKWHSFTDKRDRKIIEYVCDYAPAKALLQELTDKRFASIELTRKLGVENDTDILVRARKTLEEALTSHDALIAKKEDLERNGSQDVLILQRDQEIMSSIRSCTDIDPTAFGNHLVQSEAKRLVQGCTPRENASTLASLSFFIQDRIKVAKRLHENAVRDFPRQFMNSESKIRVSQSYLDERLAKAEKSAQNPDVFVEEERMLKARLTAFQGVREVSQWTVLDGEPTYLGSRVDAVFDNQPVEVPVDALFVFNQAADDPAGLTPLYEYLLQRMFAEFKVPSEK